MLYCNKCGARVKKNQEYCAKCGNHLNKYIYINDNKKDYVKKCPNCGAELNNSTLYCPYCGHEVNKIDFHEDLHDFIDRVNECEERMIGFNQPVKSFYARMSRSKKFWWVFFNIIFVGYPLLFYYIFHLLTLNVKPKLNGAEDRLALVIENFPLPYDRESMVHSLLFIKSKITFIMDGDINKKSCYWVRKWTGKAKQIKYNADVMLRNDETINNIYNDIIIINRFVKKKKFLKTVAMVLIIAAIIILTLLLRYIDLESLLNKLQ